MSATPNIPLPSPAYLANCHWIMANLDQLAARHPDQWIAVDHDRVLAAGPDLGVVTRNAEQASASPDCAYEFIAGASLIF
jgi:hypothetical protein